MECIRKRNILLFIVPGKVARPLPSGEAAIDTVLIQTLLHQNVLMLNSLRSLSKQSQLQLGSQAFCLVVRLQFTLF